MSKNFEIERKFLVKNLPENLDKYESFKIKQAYIHRSPVIRIRQKNDNFILTIKGEGKLKREEFEMELSKEQFDSLSTKTEGNVIEKTRYIIPIHCELKAELDVFSGYLNGLLLVEVEFSSTDEAEKFVPPTWFGCDVTQDCEYSNSELSNSCSAHQK